MANASLIEKILEKAMDNHANFDIIISELNAVIITIYDDKIAWYQKRRIENELQDDENILRIVDEMIECLKIEKGE
jgi:hypothetical protein